MTKTVTRLIYSNRELYASHLNRFRGRVVEHEDGKKKPQIVQQATSGVGKELLSLVVERLTRGELEELKGDQRVVIATEPKDFWKNLRIRPKTLQT